ncbi:MAG TPA: hypothetical protein PLJ71_04325 [Candidatus Hydrogenedentes bacterium]|nr:hypothetical protein [Candidatus Hydrogenedentota bacterium]HQM47888.1 hypothetical protein [Candidatus Hydrogenedentota bacterium]
MYVSLCIISVLCVAAPQGNPGEGAQLPERWFAYRSFRPSSEPIREFAQLGVDMVCIFPANTDCSLGVPYCVSPPIWTGRDRYDFASLDAQVSMVREANPRAKLLCLVDLNTPLWWVRLHGRQSGFEDTFYDQGKTIATPKWREDTRAYLQAFLTHMQKTYPGLVQGYVLACGGTTEWQDCSWGEESATRRAAWRAWMQERGKPDPIDIPPASVREHVTHGIFRDPAEDALAVDYWRFAHWVTGDGILYFARAAQEVLNHETALGVFYGYILELADSRLLYEGHLDFDRVYRSPDLDFFISPGTYHDRQTGGGSGYMVALESVRYHGKRFLHEIDHRTHTSKSTVELGVAVPGHNDGFPNEQATIAGLRREFSLALVEGTALWWFDMFGDWFKGQPVLDAIGQMQALWKDLASEPRVSASEVAMIVDADSMLFVDGKAPVVRELMYNQRAGLYRMGAPFDVISMADLVGIDMTRYKLVLFPNLFVVDRAKREVLDSKILRDSKTVVWVYAPGIIDGERYDPANVESLTGHAYGTQEMASKQMSAWTSVFAPTPNLPGGVLHELAQRAGVHVYSDAQEPLYANARFLAAHSLEGGDRTYRLPRTCARVTELFSGRVVAENAGEFTDRLDAPGTVLYRLDY